MLNLYPKSLNEAENCPELFKEAELFIFLLSFSIIFILVTAFAI